MMPLGKKACLPQSSLPRESETFWASYSDLMAGLLMIFALTTAITLLDIRTRLIEPTQVVMEWEKIVKDICHDKDLAAIENVDVDCNTGALVISEKNLRFGFGKTELGAEAEKVLRDAVPKYLEIVHRYPKFLKRIELIEVSGHTDKVDARSANPFISRERAGQVLAFLCEEPSMKPYQGLLKEKAVTAGYSDTRFPNSCIEPECAQARRVEITIRLKETDVLRDFLNILRQIIK
jgi:outer membrane protein OmpA-like peptidoglycan-associated protein